MVERPSAIAALAKSLAELQAHLFTLVPPVALPAQHDRLTSKIRIAARRIDPSLLEALEHLPRSDVGTRLCHGDLHPGNVILGRDGPVLIDWFDASRGDRAADIARTALLQSHAASGPNGPQHLVNATPELLEMTMRSYLAAVSELVPLGQGELDRWTAVVAVARLAEGVEPDGLLALWDEWRSRHVSSSALLGASSNSHLHDLAQVREDGR
jgi:Ser/Thr protein kinase RdoA (MazF antagonist)